MSAQTVILILYLILAVLYLPLIVTLYRRPAGQEKASILLGFYIALASVFTLFEGLWRSGQVVIPSQQLVYDLQLYGAFLLSFLLTLSVLSFIRRPLMFWFGLGLLWAAGLILILPNIHRFGDVIWQSGGFALTRERLAPTWAMLGWLIFKLAGFFSVRSAHNNSRQPLLRNRLNYWTPVFLLVFVNDGLVMVGFPIPGNPLRLAAAGLATFVIVTHDPPDLREVARRVATYHHGLIKVQHQILDGAERITAHAANRAADEVGHTGEAVLAGHRYSRCGGRIRCHRGSFRGGRLLGAVASTVTGGTLVQGTLVDVSCPPQAASSSAARTSTVINKLALLMLTNLLSFHSFPGFLQIKDVPVKHIRFCLPGNGGRTKEGVRNFPNSSGGGLVENLRTRLAFVGVCPSPIQPKTFIHNLLDPGNLLALVSVL